MDKVEKRKKRKALLRKIILQILSGQANGFQNVCNQTGATKQYQSPLDRSSYNYGYMTTSEIGAGSPNVW